MRPSFRASHRHSANGDVKYIPVRALREFSLASSSTSQTVTSSPNSQPKDPSSLSPASFLLSYSIGQQWRFERGSGDPATHNLSRRECMICYLLAIGLVMACLLLLLPPLMSSDGGRESLMSMWVGRGRLWQQQLVEQEGEQNLLQPQLQQRQQPSSPLSRDDEPPLEGTVLHSDTAPHGESHEPSETTGGTAAQGTGGKGTDAATGESGATGEPEAGEAWVEPGGAWPFRYERVGMEMEWREGGVAFRGAQWRAAIGRWMNRHAKTLPVVETKQRFFSRPCPSNCSGRGVCNQETGECRCSIGQTGPHCSSPDPFPCNNPSTAKFALGNWVLSVCPTYCDVSNARCVCGPNSTDFHRPVTDQCGYPDTFHEESWWNKPQVDQLYSTDPSAMGWCTADVAAVADGRQTLHPSFRCYCLLDGSDGLLCSAKSHQTCIGGCNGRGRCDQGYCQCIPGWYGIDCSIPSQQAITSTSSALPPTPAISPPPLPPPLWLRSSEQQPLSDVTIGIASTSSLQRIRPLIYIYDLPANLSSNIFQGRHAKNYCFPWLYSWENRTWWEQSWLYGLEVAVLEALLASRHRTNNADEADYFYVPLPGACIFARADDSPRFSMQGKYLIRRPNLAADFYLAAHSYIRTAFPYWDRHGGRDHIWMFPWDEGACSAPQAIWPSILVSHWGNTMAAHNRSTSTYPGDSWAFMPTAVRGDHPCFDPSKDIVMPAWKANREGYFLEKQWMRPLSDRSTFFYFNGQLGHEFEGGRPEANYSMGIRQQVGRLFASSPSKERPHGSLSAPDVVVTNVRSTAYATELSSSRFCGVFPGDGFSARMEDAVLHGCIPVIVQDGILLPFEPFLDFNDFAVRIAEEDIPDMINILRSIPTSRQESLHRNVQGIRLRWQYGSVMALQALREEQINGGREVPGWDECLGFDGQGDEWGGISTLADWRKRYKGHMTEPMEVDQSKGNNDDAIDTLMQVLYFKLYNDPWRKALQK